ncbi:MAG: cysteine synthase A [Clostridia bacterium]|nr:cysteine synthase A [Clostridia bacterium]MBQ8720087.1 cysteine synthase A [Clostridia bacterium]
MPKIFSSIDSLIGKTPMAELCRTERQCGANARIFAKLEYFNPAGSVKDRVALQMILDAEAEGKLGDGTVIIEPTSGNTGIGLAAVSAARGYRAIIVMPSNMSEERIKLIRAYGAEVVLTDAALGMTGAIERARSLAKEISPSFIPDQFSNPSNPRAHAATGEEIYSDMDGEVDIFVAGVGTGGTLSGVGRYLKMKNPSTRVVAVEPASSPYLSAGVSGSHGIQGIGAGFLPDNLDMGVYDEIITVTDADAKAAARRLAACEGYLVGISSGAALFAAETLAVREENRGKRIVVLLPDSGERYLSCDLFES